jgi:hypothetical protein
MSRQPPSPKWFSKKAPLRHKFNAQPTWVSGIRFASKKEAKRYEELRLLQAAQEVSFFLMQVPFHMPGAVQYRADFVVFWMDGLITIEDVKGYRAPM